MRTVTRLVLFGLALGVCSCKKTADPAIEKQCYDRLAKLGAYLAIYESKYHSYPDPMTQIQEPGICSDISICQCPFSPGVPYIYRGKEAGAGPGNDFAIAYCPAPHPDGCRHVVFVKVRVQKVTEAELQKVLQVK